MTDDGEKITAAVFRGKTLAHLEHIRENIKEMKKDLKTKACKKDLTGMKKSINHVHKRIDKIKLTSAVIGGVGGVITGVLAYFGFNK